MLSTNEEGFNHLAAFDEMDADDDENIELSKRRATQKHESSNAIFHQSQRRHDGEEGEKERKLEFIERRSEKRFLMLGHGTIHKIKRIPIPDGVRLVYTSHCGDIARDSALNATEGNFFGRGLDPLPIIYEPSPPTRKREYNTTWHGEEIIVKTGGARLTNSSILPLLWFSWFEPDFTESVLLRTSGLYLYNDTEDQDMDDIILPRRNGPVITIDIVRQIFKNSHYPTVENVIKLFDKSELTFYTFKTRFEERFLQRSIKTIMNLCKRTTASPCLVIVSSCRIFDGNMPRDTMIDARRNSFGGNKISNKRKRKTRAFKKTRKH